MNQGWTPRPPTYRDLTQAKWLCITLALCALAFALLFVVAIIYTIQDPNTADEGVSMGLAFGVFFGSIFGTLAVFQWQRWRRIAKQLRQGGRQ